MKKEELRKVEYFISTSDTEKKIGYFHRWLVHRDTDGNEDLKGLIEKENGELIYIQPGTIKFIS